MSTNPPSSNDPSLYEKVLAVAGGAVAPENRPPRPSASVVLWRRGDDGIEVYWVKRAATLRFMAGFHAFPGGGLSRKDAAVPIHGRPQGAEGGPSPVAMPETLTDGLGEAPDHLVPGLLACALRELLEETGILPLPAISDTQPHDAAHLEGSLAAARSSLLAKEHPPEDIFRIQELELHASDLVFGGRWLTPPLGPMRFDNRFFLLEWPAELPVQPLVVPGELDHGEWIRPAAALDLWNTGAVITAPPILHLLRVLHEDGPEAGLERLREPAEVNLGTFRRVEFRPGVILLPLRTATLPPAFHTNAFVLGSDQRLLIDPGPRDAREIERLIDALETLGIGEPGRFAAIALTHHHPDHIGAVRPLVERYGLPVWAHRATAERLGAAGISVDRHLEDGETLELAGDPGASIRVFHTPGHARGHLCFLDEGSSSLIAGDLVSTLSTIVIDPPEGDMDQYLSSLERMADVTTGSLFPSHGPPVKDGAGKLREFLEHRLWREGRIREAWNDGIRTASELRPLVYEDIPEVAYPLAERQILAHLDRLEARGEIRR